MSLSITPDELLVEIVKDVPLADLLSFALTCRQVWRVCCPLLEHQARLKEKYRCFKSDEKAHGKYMLTSK